MAFRLDGREDVGNLTLGADKERSAHDAHDLLSIHVFLFQHVKLLSDFFFVVGQQGVRQGLLFLKLELRLWSIRRDAEDDQPGFLQLGICVAEPARLQRSTGGVGFGIEEQDDILASKLIERDGVSVFVGQSEVGSF